MFVTGPLTARDLTDDQVRVRAAVGRTFDDVTGQVLNPTLRGYVADLTAPHGLAVRADLLEQGAGHSYGEMCVPLLADLVSAERPADLLVLATAVPDIRYGRATATYLSWHCPGVPLAFTVCDQGLLAAFTALHLIDRYARTGGCRRAVLLVAEQPTLYHELPVPTPVPDRAAAAGVLLETDGGEVPADPRCALSVRRHPRLAAHQVAEVLAAEVAGLRDDRAAPTVLLGAGLAEAVGDRDLRGSGYMGGEVLVCRENQPLTGVWLELARGLSGWRDGGGRDGGGRVLLADYDPALGQLFSATVGLG